MSIASATHSPVAIEIPAALPTEPVMRFTVDQDHEVADSALSRDRGIKRRIYARAAVPIYWIVNLVGRQIEVYSDPPGPAEKPE